MEENNKGGDPSISNVADASATVAAPVVAETTVPKSRFDEVNEAKKAAEEKARIYKEALDQNKNATEEEKALRQQAEAQVHASDQAAWKANALRSINPLAAQTLESVGAAFDGNSQEEYVTWAKTMEAKIPTTSKASIDGNRSNDEPTVITPELIASWPNAKRLEYLEKTLPKVVRD